MNRQDVKNRLDKIIGRNISTAREEHKMTRDELAFLMKLTTSHLELIERGERGATSVNLANLSKILEKPIDYFFNSTQEILRWEGQDSDAQADILTIKGLVSSLSSRNLKVIIHFIKRLIEIGHCTN